MLYVFELFHPTDEMEVHCDREGCHCKTLVLIENFAVYVVHQPPPEMQYNQAIKDFLSRCLN